MHILALHHVQLAIPEGGEETAREFYAELLGLKEVAKPAALAGRGGLWLESGHLRVHLGVEQGFRPAKKAHPAFLVENLRVLQLQLQDAGVGITEDNELPGFERIYVSDPFGNRIELLEPRSEKDDEDDTHP